MIFAVFNVWFVLAPVIAAQYLFASVALFVLAKRNCTAKTYVLWNIFILAVFFVGSATFLIYDKLKPYPKTEKGGEEDGNDE